MLLLITIVLLTIKHLHVLYWR